jgi:hypothetical protein
MMALVLGLFALVAPLGGVLFPHIANLAGVQALFFTAGFGVLGLIAAFAAIRCDALALLRYFWRRSPLNVLVATTFMTFVVLSVFLVSKWFVATLALMGI